MKNPLLNTSFLAIIACLLWSSAFVGIKIGLPYTSPLHFAGIRFFISGLMILPFTGGFRSHIGFLKGNMKIVLIISLLNTFLHYALFYTGLSMVPAALGAIIVGSGPLFVALVAHLMMPGDKLTLKKLIIFIFGFSGIVFVSFGRNDFSGMEKTGITGILLLLIVNLLSGFGNVFVARDAGKVPPLVLSSTTMIIGGGALYLFSIPLEGFHPEIKALPYYISLAWLSFLSASAISIWFVLLKRPGIKVSDLNFWKFLIPVTGAILAWILLPDEKPSLVALIGMVIIAFSLILLNIYRRRHL